MLSSLYKWERPFQLFKSKVHISISLLASSGMKFEASRELEVVDKARRREMNVRPKEMMRMAKLKWPRSERRLRFDIDFETWNEEISWRM